MNVPCLCDFHTCFESLAGTGKGTGDREFLDFQLKIMKNEKKFDLAFLKTLLEKYGKNRSTEFELFLK